MGEAGYRRNKPTAHRDTTVPSPYNFPTRGRRPRLPGWLRGQKLTRGRGTNLTSQFRQEPRKERPDRGYNRSPVPIALPPSKNPLTGAVSIYNLKILSDCKFEG